MIAMSTLIAMSSALLGGDRGENMEPEIQVTDSMLPVDCPYCEGKRVAFGCVSDVFFEFDCVCIGGNEEAVRWLLGMPPLHED